MGAFKQINFNKALFMTIGSSMATKYHGCGASYMNTCIDWRFIRVYTLCICFGVYTIRDFVIRAPLRLCNMVAKNRMAESVWHIQYMFGGDTYWALHVLCASRRHTKPKDRFVTVAGKRARLDINPIRTYGHTRHAVHSVVAPRNYFAAHFVA